MSVDVTDLYRGPLDGFVARRASLAKQLRDSEPTAAASVAKLRKPSVGAWAIDQLPIENADLITELLAAGADAREAQHDAAGGAANAEALLDASARVRDLVEAAVRAAISVLDRAGHASSEDTLRRIRTTLQAAITGATSDRHALWTGTLDRDLEPAGFGSPEDVEDDVPEVAAAIAPLRRAAGPNRARAGPDRTRQHSELAAQRAAERAADESERQAERARTIAATKRENADRLADEARRAAEEATAAEAAAATAEEAVRTLRAKVGQ
jgi:hypothetical protein